MELDNRQKLALGVAGLIAFITYISAYTVDQRETALKFRFREIVENNIEPGLHFQAPFMDHIERFPSQILTLRASSERFLTGEKKYVLVDFFAKWRIADTEAYYRATGGGRIGDALNRMEDILKDGLRNEFSRRTIEQALSEERNEIMQGIQVQANNAAQKLGIEIVDVRVSKIDFPEEISDSVYERMRSERVRVAQDFRSRGKEEAEKQKAAADRKATIILAEAYRDSEKLKGQGDAQAAETYANAYSADEEFYSFYRSLMAYRNTLGKQTDTMVLEPDSQFFRYFKQQGQSDVQPVAPAPKPAVKPQAAAPKPVTKQPQVVAQPKVVPAAPAVQLQVVPVAPVVVKEKPQVQPNKVNSVVVKEAQPKTNEASIFQLQQPKTED